MPAARKSNSTFRKATAGWTTRARGARRNAARLLPEAPCPLVPAALIQTVVRIDTRKESILEHRNESPIAPAEGQALAAPRVPRLVISKSGTEAEQLESLRQEITVLRSAVRQQRGVHSI